MSYLVDANVLSEPTAAHPDARVVQWLREHEQEIWVDPIILGEIRFGILLLPQSTRRRRLERWFTQGLQRIRALEWDAATGMRWAQLLAHLRESGNAMPIKDSFIAASALHHGLTLATRNASDFRHVGLKIANPFDQRPTAG